MKKLLMAAAVATVAIAEVLANSQRNGQVEIDGRTFEYTYTLYDNGVSNVVITAISPSIGEISIPALIDDAPVTGMPAFRDNKNITRVTIPTSITSIGSYQFQNCTNLTYINIDHIRTFGAYAFDNCRKLDTALYVSTNTYFQSDWNESRAFGNCTSLTNVTFHPHVKSLGGGHACRSIFYYCGLQDLELPPALKYIDGGMFQYSAVREVVMPDSLENLGFNAFRGCTNLSRVVFGSGMTDTGEDHVFEDCTLLSEVTLTSSIMNITPGTFEDCRSLEHIDIPSSVRVIGMSAFKGSGLKSILIPDSVEALGRSPFANTPLTRATLSKNIKYIPQQAFANCTNLTAIIIPDGVTNIADGAFANTALERIMIPSTVELIGANAFSSCTNLKEVVLSGNIAAIGSSAFADCTALGDIVVPDSVTNIDSRAFYGCTSLTNAVFGRNVKALRSEAFAGCAKLKDIVLSHGLTRLEDSAFKSCRQIENLVIPDGVAYIAGSTFYGCSGLTNVTIGSGVSSIGASAFRYCEQVTNVTLGVNVQTIYNNAFDGTYPNRVTVLGPLPTSGANNLPRSSYTKKYVVAERHLASWLPWITANTSARCFVVDETTQEEVRVAIGEGGAEAVGVMSALGLSPARSTDANGAVATYAMPEIGIKAFDPAVGRVEVLVTPAADGAVSGDLVTSCVAVEGSDNLTDWETVPGMVIEASRYREAGHEGRFSCTFDATTHRFYRVSVSGR